MTLFFFFLPAVDFVIHSYGKVPRQRHQENLCLYQIWSETPGVIVHNQQEGAILTILSCSLDIPQWRIRHSKLLFVQCSFKTTVHKMFAKSFIVPRHLRFNISKIQNLLCKELSTDQKVLVHCSIVVFFIGYSTLITNGPKSSNFPSPSPTGQSCILLKYPLSSWSL